MSTMIAEVDRIAAMANPGQTDATWLQVMADIHPRYGGLSSAIPELSRALQPYGISAPVAALCLAEEAVVPWQIAPEAMHFFPRPHRAWMPQAKSHAELKALVDACDGVHVHGLWTPASHAASRAARRAGKPLCLTAHGMLEPWSLRQHRLRKQLYAMAIEHRVLRGAACLHALTRSEAESYRAITRDVPIAIVPNGVDVPTDIAKQHFFAVYPHLQGKRIVLFLSRLHPKKAVDVLVRVWPRVQAGHGDAHLVIAGVGEAGYEAHLKALSMQHCPQEAVTFTGLLQGRIKWAALRAAECFVLPSHSEGFSVAILEALGAGTPVVATRQCNMPELNTAGCGWLTEPNEEALSAVLEEVLSSLPAANEQVGERGRALIEERYTWAAVAGQMAEVYRWLGGAAMPAGTEVLQ